MKDVILTKKITIHLNMNSSNKIKHFYFSLFNNLFLIPEGRSFFPTSVAGFMQANRRKSSCLTVGVTSLKSANHIQDHSYFNDNYFSKVMNWIRNKRDMNLSMLKLKLPLEIKTFSCYYRVSFKPIGK